MANRLASKIVLVTGGTSGIGFAIARLFADEGAHVYITGRREDVLERAVAELGGNVTGIAADSASLADLDRVYARIEADHGHLDVVVANAGGGSMLRLQDVTEAHYDDIFGRNVKGVVFTVQKAVRLLRPGASVILLGSVVGIEGNANFSIYGASKAAVRNFARSWILDLKAEGVRVNVVSPGPVETTGLVELAGTDKAQQQGLLDHLASTIPLGRVGRPEEIARVALFLASDESSFVNGAEIFADGGKAQI